MKSVAQFIDKFYLGTVQFIIGVLGGAIYWVAPGILITMVMLTLGSFFGKNELQWYEILVIWIVIPLLLGSVIGHYYKMGGGLISGVMLGGVSGWLISSGFPTRSSDTSISTLLCGIPFIAIFIGTLIGAISGAIGGGLVALAGKSPIDSEVSKKSWVKALGFVSIILLSFLMPFIVYSIPIAFQESNQIPDTPMLTILMLCGMSIISALLGAGLFWVIRKAEQRYFHDKPSISPALAEVPLGIWYEFVPIALGFVFETISKPIFGLSGLGIVFGAGIGKVVEELWRARKKRLDMKMVLQICFMVFAVMILKVITNLAENR